MEGFQDGVAVQAKVSWSATEVALLNGKPTTYGLLAEIPTAGVPGGVTRYFVPWTSVTYLKQDIPPQAPPGVVATAPPVAVPTVTPPGKGG